MEPEGTHPDVKDEPKNGPPPATIDQAADNARGGMFEFEGKTYFQDRDKDGRRLYRQIG